MTNNPITMLISLFFNGAMIMAGILLIPHIVYLVRHMSSEKARIINWLFFTTGLIGCFGLILLGLFPIGNEPGHMIATFMSFGSFAASCGFSAIRILINISQKNSNFKIWHWVCTFVPMAIVGIMSQIVTYVPDLLGPLSESVLFVFPLWEWAGLFALAIWLLGVFFMLE